MLSKTTLLALTLAAAHFTIAAPSHNEARERIICSKHGDQSNCAEDEICLSAGADDAPDEGRPKVFECIKKSELTKPWPRAEGCSASVDCDEGLVCRPNDSNGPTIAVLQCLPPLDCSTDADCGEDQECIPDQTGGINTQTLKCLDKPAEGQCRTEQDCDGKAVCAFTLQYPKPEFGRCLGGNTDGNSDHEETEETGHNEKRTKVVPCTEEFKCQDVNDVCVTRTFFFNEGLTNLCLGKGDAEDGDWCQGDEDCEGEKTCAPQTSAPRPMSGTCVVQK